MGISCCTSIGPFFYFSREIFKMQGLKIVSLRDIIEYEGASKVKK